MEMGLLMMSDEQRAIRPCQAKKSWEKADVCIWVFGRRILIFDVPNGNKGTPPFFPLKKRNKSF